ncbi:MAG: hemolytic enterotoxin [Xenococcaceae cyanobacterium]
MSNTPIQVTTELSQVLERIDLKIDKLDQKIDKLDEKFETKLDKIDERLNKLEVGQAEMKGDIKALDKRLESQEFVSRGVLVGLIIAILGGFAKLFGFVGNP